MSGRIRRKGYVAKRKSQTIYVKGTSKHKSYTRKLSKKSIRVKSSLIKDRGLPGKGPKLWSVRKGGLRNFGYSTSDSASQRHAALERAIAKNGATATERRLIAISNYNKRTSPRTHKIMREDITYIHNKYFA